MTAGPRWMPMRPEHLDAVVRIAAAVHPGYPEDAAVFAERLALSPDTCLILSPPDNGPLGYAIAHWWKLGDAPRLNTLIGALPANADTLYIHDVAILPAARFMGAANALLARLETMARARRIAAMSLVAVNGSAPFWTRCGFEAVRDGGLAGKLATYGGDARYMVRAL